MTPEELQKILQSDDKLNQELKNNNIPIWIIGAMLVFALKDKGE